MSQQGPTVGRIVHYTSQSGSPRALAALVTEVWPDGDTVGLWVFKPRGTSYSYNVRHAPGDTPTPGCWHWPPRAA